MSVFFDTWDRHISSLDLGTFLTDIYIGSWYY